MGGVISGVLHAPLTGIFLIAEITGGYTLFVPLMMVSAGSYFITRYFEPNSIYKKTLVERGMLLNEDNGLQLVSIRAVVEKDFITLKTDQTLYDLVDAIAHCRRNIFPVINENNELQGIVLMDEIREVMFKTNLYRTTSIAELMTIPPVRVDQNTSLDEVIKLFEKFAIWHIPVEENGKYSGMISKSGVLQFYREQLAQQEQTKVAL